MSNKPVFTIAGDVCIDHNVVNNRKYISWGSSVMYMGRFLINHPEFDLKIIASHGEDFCKYLHEIKIVNNSEAINTLVYENIVMGDKRTQFCHNLSSSRPVEIDEPIRGVLKSTNIFIFAPLTPNYQPSYVQSLLKHVPENCLKVLTPQGYMRHIDIDGLVTKSAFANEKYIVPLFDIVIVSDEDGVKPLEAAQRWVRFKKELNVIVTQNKNGATLINKNGLQHIETVPVAVSDISDPVGSGDVFSIQTALDYYENRDIVQAIVAGNTTARQKLLAS